MGKDKRKKSSRQHYQRPADEDELEEEFQVEKIIRSEMRGGKLLYYIKWKGYSDAENTWEPESNLVNCPELLQDFKASKGDEDSEVAVVGDDSRASTSSDKESGPSGLNAKDKDRRDTRKKTPKKSAAIDGQNGEKEKKLSGFDRGLKLKKILGATEGTDGELKGSILFLVKWQGEEQPELVPAKEANVRYPQEVIKFYESQLSWNES
jgi:hypothetical protein